MNDDDEQERPMIAATATARTAAAPDDALSDEALLAQTAQGDARAFEVLFRRHYDRVYGILFRLVGERGEAEDLAQEVFLRLHNHARRRRDRDENVGAWLYRVAVNHGYNALRDRRRRQQRDALLLPPPTGDAEAELLRREERRLVRAALARLGERQAQLLILRQMEFSYAECAAVVGVAPGSVGTLLARAARDFRQAYERERPAVKGREG
jgi:RNA polymerase sigma-70 factor (ECF subfamily)